jgi:hypothetical protein
MKETDVPQEDSFYQGGHRACYATDEKGHYKIVPSRGWEVEKIFTAQAIDEVDREIFETHQKVLAGELSPLAFHMTARLMTPTLLAQNMEIWTWRVRRHLRPAVFRKLSMRMLDRYARCLDLSVEALKEVPHDIDSNTAGG